MIRWLVLALVAMAVGVVVWRYSSDLARARDQVRHGSAIVDTAAGPLEYAETGRGIPVLVIHGAGGGFDQGLAIAADLVGDGYRVIAPSRFGYLRTSIPRDASPAAQADAHAALLDKLAVPRAIVVGVSAGARSAVELAIRHPDKVLGLIAVVPGTFSPTSPVSISAGRGNDFAFFVVNHGGDFAWWAAEKTAPSALIRFIGVPPELVRNAPAHTRRRVMTVVESMEPLSQRFAGINVDSRPDRKAPALAAVTAPTLVISARDDLFNTRPAAEFLADRIPGARLIVYDSGGHLLIGHEAEVRARVKSFIAAATASPSRATLESR